MTARILVGADSVKRLLKSLTAGLLLKSGVVVMCWSVSVHDQKMLEVWKCEVKMRAWWVKISHVLATAEECTRAVFNYQREQPNHKLRFCS